MIKKIKSLVRKNLENQKQLIQATSAVNASLKLNSLFNDDVFIPYTAWAMSPQTVLHILNIIEVKKPKAIIEFGSGVTTIYIAKLLKSSGIDCKFYSIESNESWKDSMELKLKQLNIEKHVNIILSPLSKVKDELKFKNQTQWYNDDVILEQFPAHLKFDLVIVDGPYGGSSSFARYSAFPFLKDNIDSDTDWFLDDTNRRDEKSIIEEWQRLSNLNVKHFFRYSILRKSSIFNFEPYKI